LFATPVANLPPVSLTLVANLPLVSTTPVELVAKFAAGVVDTGGAP
jgi:predicted solute-binding protein